MKNEIEIKTWKYNDTHKITLVSINDKLVAKVYDPEGKLEYTIPSHDINLPKEMLKKDSLSLLPLFLQDTYIRLSKLSDGSAKIYINPRLNGGGWWDGLVSLITVISGIALAIQTRNVSAIVGSGLIGAGINGFKHAITTNENFNKKYLQQTVGGFTSGATLRASGQLASSINSKIVDNNLALLAKTTIHSAGGALSQAIGSKIMDDKVDKNKIILGAVINGGVGTLTGMRSLDTETHMMQAPSKVLEEGYTEIAYKEATSTFIGSTALIQTIIHTNILPTGSNRNKKDDQKINGMLAEMDDQIDSLEKSNDQSSIILQEQERTNNELRAINDKARKENARLRKQLAMQTTQGQAYTTTAPIQKEQEPVNIFLSSPTTLVNPSRRLADNMKPLVNQLKEEIDETNTHLLNTQETQIEATIVLEEQNQIIKSCKK